MRLRSTLLTAAAAAALIVTAATPDPRAPVRRLGATSAREREDASAELLRMGDDARPALEEAVDAPDPEVRGRARALLARLGDDDRAVSERRYREAVRLLRGGVADGAAGAAGVSSAADGAGVATPDGAPAAGTELDARLRALAPESGAALADLALATSRRTFVAGPLAAALARHATPDTLAALATLWRGDRLLPSAALAAARDLDAATDGDPDRTAALQESAAAALVVLGDPLDVREAPRRRAGVALAAAFGGRAAHDVLNRAAQDGDAGVRREAARALGRHLPITGAPTLADLAADRDAGVREAALTALLRVPGAPRPGPAARCAQDGSTAVRRAAATLLARDATPAEVPLLETLATDPSDSVRAAARRSLAALGAPR